MERQYGKDDSAALRVHRICREIEETGPTRGRVQRLIEAIDRWLGQMENGPMPVQ